MKLTKIEQMFAEVAKVRGGVFLLRTDDAIRFVQQCRIEAVPVAGIEGFRMHGEKIQPIQEHSIDFEDKLDGTHDMSERFLSERASENLWFEVVTTDRVD